MNDRQDDLVSALLHEAVPEPPRDIAVADIARKVRTQRIRLITAPVAVAVLILVIAGATLIAGRGPSRQDSTQPQPATIGSSAVRDATVFAGELVLQHPTSWRYLHDDGVSYGPISGLGYLTDQPTVSQCATKTTSHAVDVTCRAPVTRINAGGVL